MYIYNSKKRGTYFPCVQVLLFSADVTGPVLWSNVFLYLQYLGLLENIIFTNKGMIVLINITNTI